MPRCGLKKMKLNRKIFLATSFFTLAAVALALDGAPLRIKATGGDVHSYKLTASMSINGMDVKVSGNIKHKILKVEDNGNITTEESQSGLKIDFGGQTIDAPDSPATVSVLRSDGTLVEIRGAAAGGPEYRLANLDIIKFPDFALEKDKTWEYDVKADEKTGAVKMHADYKVLGDEKVGGVDCWKISLKSKELTGDQPASVDATVWLGKADALLIKYQAKGVNLPIPGAPEPVSGDQSLELVP